MIESSAFAGTPPLDYEAWMDLMRSYHWGDLKVSEPSAFAGWRRSLSVCGFETNAIKTQCGSGATDRGRNAYGVERTHRDVRRRGRDDFCAIFQAAGRSAVNQNDQAVELAAGDVLLVDTSRPLTFSRTNGGQNLSLRLPRQPLVSHLGFEPQGGFCGRSGTLATRLLSQLVWEAPLSAPGGPYMRLAVYDLLGALLAPSDSLSVSRHTDKLFRRICGIIKDRFADPDFGPCEVAAEAGISVRYLQQLFTERGSTCIHFIQSLRLDHAAHLLRRREALGVNQPLCEIAYACGFRDYNYFRRIFRRRFGQTPSAHAGDQ